MAQSVNKDYSGYIKKYDANFHGIGPTVYFLPAPQSKAEKIADQFKEIDNFKDTIQDVSLYHQLVTAFENTDNYTNIQEIISTQALKYDNWNSVVEKQVQLSNYAMAIGLLNEFARQYILQKDYDQAESLLKQALELANSPATIEGKSVLLANLYALYLYNKKLVEANNIEEISYNEAKKNKSLTAQGNSLVKLAMLQTYEKQYNAAENTIIRKAIPLFNRAKDYDGKINAWVKLAEVYTANKQYPQAQWFLIQAQELASTKKITKYDTAIEFMLGYSKFYQNNLLVSQKELKTALKLAQENGDKYIEISANQMLGEIALKQNKIEEAETFLKSYWELRKKLF